MENDDKINSWLEETRLLLEDHPPYRVNEITGVSQAVKDTYKEPNPLQKILNKISGGSDQQQTKRITKQFTNQLKNIVDDFYQKLIRDRVGHDDISFDDVSTFLVKHFKNDIHIRMADHEEDKLISIIKKAYEELNRNHRSLLKGKKINEVKISSQKVRAIKNFFMVFLIKCFEMGFFDPNKDIVDGELRVSSGIAADNDPIELGKTSSGKMSKGDIDAKIKNELSKQVTNIVKKAGFNIGFNDEKVIKKASYEMMKNTHGDWGKVASKLNDQEKKLLASLGFEFIRVLVSSSN